MWCLWTWSICPLSIALPGAGRTQAASRKPQAASQGSGGASFPCKSFLPPSAGIIVVPAGKCICTSLLDCEPSQFSTIMCLALYIT
ncbi:hypothetical protein HYQ44_019419 [Verticillium longisporum]|nr:hypothetical protein HYQ44_019419 [Verticillium longisporum]